MNELYPIDKWNQLEAETTAERIAWPDSFSDKAKETLRYFDADSDFSTIFLFRYKGRLIVTDESLYLTDYGDGIHEPFGGPRGNFNSMKEIENWLELIHDELSEDGWDFETMGYKDEGLPWEMAE